MARRDEQARVARKRTEPHGGPPEPDPWPVPEWSAPGPAETKPFFATSELFGVLAILAALAVTAASSDSFNGELLWPLATAIVAGYVFSRGFAKVGSPSRSWDPRERETAWRNGRNESSARGASAGGDKPDRVAGAERHTEEDTRQMSTVAPDDYGTMTRGRMVGQPYAYGRGFGMRHAFPIETKPFFLTSEFWGSLALIVALAIAAGTSEQVDARLFWILATAITVGYVISRGISKSGTKSRSWDPREDLMESARERVSRQDS